MKKIYSFRVTKIKLLNGLYNYIRALIFEISFKFRKRKESPFVKKARTFAAKTHAHVRHRYGALPYSYHLQMVVDACKEFITLVPEEQRDFVLAGAWLHDVIEDCRLTYNDIKNEFGVEVAEIVFACSNEKGKTRKDRANEKFYTELKLISNAVLVKCADRIANTKQSKKTRSGMYDKYLREMPYFTKKLYMSNFDVVFKHLNQL